MVIHEVLLRGAISPEHRENLEPTLLKMTDQDFINRLLIDLDHSGGQSRLSKMTVQALVESTAGSAISAKSMEPHLRLYQPVHRTFHPVVLEACCCQPGEPRLDPQRILKAGIVVRRLNHKNQIEGWIKSQGKIIGWKPLSSGLQAGFGDDPDPDIRKKCRLGKNSTILNQLENQNSPQDQNTWQEDFAPLFVAPPDTCNKWGKTFLYGLTMLTSNERSEPISGKYNPDNSPPFDRKDIFTQLPSLLTEKGTKDPELPGSIHRESAESSENKQVIDFMTMLRYLAQNVGLFTDEPEVETLASRFKEIQYLKGRMTFFDFLKIAYGILIEKKDTLPETLTFSGNWPQIKHRKIINRRSNKATLSETEVVEGIYGALTGRWEKMNIVPARYDDSDNRYVISCFIRVKEKCDCPPKTIWTNPTAPFSIVPWFESGDQPPIQVELPAIDANKPENLAKLRPNVAFKVPPELKQFMEKLDMNKILKGKSDKGSQDFGMICGFNIPIITICAFFVLQIFLGLLQIIFWWLPFVRICIPFPKVSKPPGG